VTGSAAFDVTRARALWDHGPGFLNTASYGLPPKQTIEALRQAQDQWVRGEVDWDVWTDATEIARHEFGRLIGVPPNRIATGAAVSQLLAPVAAAVPDGSTVLVPDIEFSSVVFPFAVHEKRSVTVRTAPLAGFVEAIVPGVDVVAVSAVQSATGEAIDIAAVASRARAIGALLVLDATHAASWADVHADAVDVGVVAAYKWLCSPRGTAFQWFAENLADRHPVVADRLIPLAAGWFAGPTIHSANYGMPLRLADDARRFDISPAWHCWVGAAPALTVLANLGSAAIGTHNIALADGLLDAIDRPPRGSAIVSVAADTDTLAKVREAGVRFAVKEGPSFQKARFSFHLYNTRDDVDQLAELLRHRRK
jgi:selenocysteine lyase/cysteine desulfurase